MEGAAQDASKEACASLEDGALAGEPLNSNQVVSDAPSAKRIIGSLLHARRSNLAILGALKARLPDRLMLGSYVKPMEWGRPLTDM